MGDMADLAHTLHVGNAMEQDFILMKHLTTYLIT